MRELLSPATREAFRAQFDCVLMLTWSNWRTEMRSNRYHYASRFARLAPVIFVQPDLPYRGYAFETTELSGMEILHVLADFHDGHQRALIDEALAARGVRRPLVWTWCFRFLDELAHRWSPCKVYHATEDYWNDELHKLIPEWKHALERSMELSHLLIGVSEGVVEAYLRNTKYAGPALANPNGCDARYWLECTQRRPVPPPARPVAFYQGNITRKIDFEMMLEVVRRMPDWDFWFAGPLIERREQFEPLLEQPNFRHFGKLHVDDLRDLAVQASCGLIPLVHEPWTIEQGSPLKAYEYVASGLPVVTVRHPFMEDDPRIYLFAETADAFVTQIRASQAIRWDADCLQARAEIASRHDYDRRFETAVDKLLAVTVGTAPRRGPARVALLCGDAGDTRTAVAWRRRSRHVLHPLDARRLSEADLDAFDGLVLMENALSAVDVPRMRRWGGFKTGVVAPLADALEAAAAVERLGLQALLCVDRERPVSRPHLDSVASPRAGALRALDDLLSRSILRPAEETRWTSRIPRELFIDPRGDFSTLTRRALPGVLLSPREATIPIVDHEPAAVAQVPPRPPSADARSATRFDGLVLLGPCDRAWWGGLLSSLFDGLLVLQVAADTASAAAFDDRHEGVVVPEPQRLRGVLQRLGICRPLIVLEDFAGAPYLDAVPDACAMLYLGRRRRLGEHALAALLDRVDLTVCEDASAIEALAARHGVPAERMVWAGGEVADAVLRAAAAPPRFERLRVRLIHVGPPPVAGEAFLERFASLSKHDVREQTWSEAADPQPCDLAIVHMRVDEALPSEALPPSHVLALDDVRQPFGAVASAAAVVSHRGTDDYPSLSASTLPWLTVLPCWLPLHGEPPPMAERAFALGVEAWPADMATRLRVERIVQRARDAGLTVEVGARPRDCRAFLVTGTAATAEGAPGVAEEGLSLPRAAYGAMCEGAVAAFLQTPPPALASCVLDLRDDLADLDAFIAALRDAGSLDARARDARRRLEAHPQYRLEAMVEAFDAWLCERALSARA